MRLDMAAPRPEAKAGFLPMAIKVFRDLVGRYDEVGTCSPA